MTFLYLGDKPIVFYLGFILIGLFIAQFITVKIKSKKRFKYHRVFGYIIFIVACVHVVTGLLLYIL
jgi:formate-dependent nitrite reductase membrane component NrfD